MKKQIFKNCASHGYDYDPEKGCYIKNRPFCYNHEVMGLGLFEVLSLCSYGGSAVVLDGKDYCKTCDHHTEDLDEEKKFERIGFSSSDSISA